MTATARHARLPRLVLSRDDHDRLLNLASAALERAPDLAEELIFELDRARLVAPSRVPPNVVRMGSTLTFSANGQTRTVTLVYPEQADIAAGRISVMTPIGTALIGLSEGQSIAWTARDGKTHELTVHTVAAPVPA